MDVKMEVDKQKGRYELERMDVQSTGGKSAKYFSPYVECQSDYQPDLEASLGVRKTSFKMTSLKMTTSKNPNEAERMDAQSTGGNSAKIFSPFVDCGLDYTPDPEANLGVQQTSCQAESVTSKNPKKITSTVCMKGGASPSINLSKLNNELSQLYLEKNNSEVQKISHRLGGLKLSIHRKTSKVSNSKELSKDECYKRDLLLLNKFYFNLDHYYRYHDNSLVYALGTWMQTYTNRYIAKKVAFIILKNYYENDFKLVIPSFYKLESFPDFSRCVLHFFQLQGQLIDNFYYPHLSCRLSILDLGHNQLNNEYNIKAILCKCTCLDTLILHNNCLRNIPVSPPDHPLTHLDVSKNKMTPVTFKDGNLLSYSSLLFLFLRNNDLRYIPQCSGKLRVLDVRSMNLNDEGVSALKELYLLENLNLANNFLTVIPEIGSRNIKHLNLGFNNIKSESDDLSLENFHQLEIVNMEHNQLTKFPRMHCNVKEIYFSENQIITDDSILNLEKLSNVTVLDLSHNHLTSFPFSRSKKLQYIYLSFNHINQYDSKVRFFGSYLEVKMIDMSANPMGQHITELKSLFSSHVNWCLFKSEVP